MKEKKEKLIVFRINGTDNTELEHFAEKMGLSVSAFVRLSIKEKINKMRKEEL